MMSAWNLVWIIPTLLMAGYCFCGLMVSNREDARYREALRELKDEQDERDFWHDAWSVADQGMEKWKALAQVENAAKHKAINDLQAMTLKASEAVKS